MIIRLPWPPKELSPNTRQHWAKHAKAKKLYRMECWAAAMKQPVELRKVYRDTDHPLKMTLTFYKPSKRSMDTDNLLARMKAGIDGVCDSIAIDDERFTTVVVKISPDTGGFVMMEVEEEVYEEV